MRFAIPSLLLLAAALPCVIAAPPADNQESPVITALRAEKDRLRIEVELSKLKIAKLEQDLADLRAIVGNLPEDKRPTEPVKPTASDDRKPKSAVPIAALFSGIPPEARPNPREGWTEFTRPKAQGWLEKNSLSRTIDHVFELSSVFVSRLPDPSDNTKTLGWKVDIYVESVELDLFGVPHTITVNEGHAQAIRATPYLRDGRFTLTVDESKALQAKALKKGQRIRIRGIVDNIALGIGQKLIDERTKMPKPTGVASVLIRDAVVEGFAQTRKPATRADEPEAGTATQEGDAKQAGHEAEKIADVYAGKQTVPTAASRFRNHSYLVIQMSGVSWDKARELCREMGGDLAVIDSREEFLFLRSLYGKGNVWMGARKADGQWKWIDGRVVDRALWHADNPVNRAGCDFVYANEHGTIGNAETTHENIPAFVCEWPRD